MPTINPQAMPSTLRQRQALRKKLIEEVERYRITSGLKKTDMHRKIGITAKHYDEIIHGGGLKVSVDSLILYLLRLGISVDVVVSGVMHDR